MTRFLVAALLMFAACLAKAAEPIEGKWKTASGETFNTNDLTAAHRTLPFGTKVRVVNKKTGKSVVVRINDRGPYAHGRVIDLSKASAQAIGISGVGSVDVAQM